MVNEVPEFKYLGCMLNKDGKFWRTNKNGDKWETRALVFNLGEVTKKSSWWFVG